MKLWPFSKKALELSLVYDIGSSTIGAALISFGEKPTVHFTVRKPIAFQEKIDPEKLLFDKRNTLRQVTEDILKIGLFNLKHDGEHGAHIHSISVMLGSPWYISKTSAVKVEKPQEFTITEDMITTLLSTEETHFKEFFHSNSSTSESVSIIEKKIVHARLNGYEVSDLFQRKARSLELSVFLSATEPRVLSQVRSVLHPAFSFRKIFFHSFPLVYFTIARDLFHDTSDFLIADIRGEVTDISLVQKSAISETVSFPLGKRTLLRNIAERLHLSPEVAVSFLKLYLNNKAEGQTKKDMKAALDSAKEDWSTMFRDALSHLSMNTLLPERVYAMADFDFGSLFARWIGDETVDRLGITTEHFNVQYVDDHMLAQYLLWGKHANHDTFLSVATLFLNKLDRLSER